MRRPIPALALFTGTLISVLAVSSCGSEEEPAGDESRGGRGGAAGTEGSTDAMPPDAGGGSAGEAPSTGSDPNDPYACTGGSQCMLVDAARDCCVASCGEQTTEFFSAIHIDHSREWHAGQVCAGCLTPCSDADAFAFRESTKTIVAVCEAGRCVPKDLAESVVTACSTDDDCFLRWGFGCCEDRDLDPERLVAASDRPGITELVCPDTIFNCGPWPAHPATAHAVCGLAGHCDVVIDGADAGPEAGP